MRLIQFLDQSGRRRVGAVMNGSLRQLHSIERVYDLAQIAIANGNSGDANTFKVTCTITMHGSFEPNIDSN